MYTKTVPYKDFAGTPKNQTVHFNLTMDEAMELVVEFKLIAEWQASIEGPERSLTVEEMREFYRAFKEVVLSAYGVPSSDGAHFRKGGRYDFQESALFAGFMVMLFSDPAVEVAKFLGDIMPEGMEEMVQASDASLKKLSEDGNTEAGLKAEVDRLRAQVAQLGQQTPA